MVEETYDEESIYMKELVGDRWREACVIQVVCSLSSDRHMADAVNRTATHSLDDGEPEEAEEYAIYSDLEEGASEVAGGVDEDAYDTGDQACMHGGERPKKQRL